MGKKIKFDGYFWIADPKTKKLKNNDKFAGELSFSKKRGGQLKLYGNFCMSHITGMNSDFQLIQGECNGKKVTIISRTSNFTHLPLLGNFDLSTVPVEVILTGEHFFELNELKLHELYLEMTNLDVWSSKTIFHFSDIPLDDKINRKIVAIKNLPLVKLMSMNIMKYQFILDIKMIQHLIKLTFVI